MLIPLLLTFGLLGEAPGYPSERIQPKVIPLAIQPEVIPLARGTSELMVLPRDVARVAIGDENVADVVVVSPREFLVNARSLGSTTLFVWDSTDTARAYTIEVSVDVAALNRQFATYFPGEAIEATAHRDVLVLSGMVSGWVVAERILQLARGTGATVIQNVFCIRPSVHC
jgi:pilus assembly protein CpaC